MNCKPGDLAVIVKTPHPMTDASLGRLVRLLAPVALPGGPCWTYEEMPLRGRSFGGSWSWYELPDEWLRPIRDPGDDAEDESFRWAPAPEKVRV